MRRLQASATRAILGLAVAAAGLAACARGPVPDALERIRERGELRVATLNGPSSYYLGAHGPEGLEFALTRAFAQELGVGLYIYPVADERALRAELVSGRADLVAAQLTFGQLWEGAGLPIAPYDQSPQVVVYRKGGLRPAKLRTLERLRIAVEADSEQLHALRALRAAHPRIGWQETAGMAIEGPLAQVAAGKADVAVVDGHEFGFLSPVYPSLGVAMSLPRKRPVQWIVGRKAEILRASAEGFFARLRTTGELEGLLHRVAGDRRSVRPEATRELPGHIEARLPSLQPLFEQASLETGLDWRLLAALGYQESQWDPRAESPNGAQGVMMLMADTAASLGVSDPWDARENILAGARYITQMRAKIPSRIPEPDRTWLALAAYNVGFGHLEDARVLTQMRGRNPDSWAEVRMHLPLLADERWYLKVKRGYARGWEPVQFVDRIQQFLNVLVWRRAGEVAGAPASALPEPPGA